MILSDFRKYYKIFRQKGDDRLLTYERYAEYRNAKGMNDYKVSYEVGISNSTFSDWKKGRYRPKAEKIIKLCKLLDIPLEVAFGDE